MFTPDLPGGLFGDTVEIQNEGGTPRFELRIHPRYRERGEAVAAIAAYQIPSINYGKMVSAEDAECFGAQALGRDREPYYELLCRLADELASQPTASSANRHDERARVLVAEVTHLDDFEARFLYRVDQLGAIEEIDLGRVSNPHH